MINFNGKCMHVTDTAANGMVNQDTIFRFVQKDDVVSASYSGGLVARGFLAGRINAGELHFKYAQEHADGNISGGASVCKITVLPKGELQLVEHFDWDQGQGKNVFREIDPS